MNPIGKTTPSFIGVMLGTGYDEFQSPSGIGGLCKVTGDRLDLLAVHASIEGKGQFREFIRQCKEWFKTICVWHIANPVVEGALERYGFTPETEIDGQGETMTGMRWDGEISGLSAFQYDIPVRSVNTNHVKGTQMENIEIHLPVKQKPNRIRAKLDGIPPFKQAGEDN